MRIVIIIGTARRCRTSAEILPTRAQGVLVGKEGSLKSLQRASKNDEAKAYAERVPGRAWPARPVMAVLAFLQGRTVRPATTTVKLTSSIFFAPRNPDPGPLGAQVPWVKGLDSASMAPCGSRMEERLGHSPWAVAGGGMPNNEVISTGVSLAGWPLESHSRRKQCVAVEPGLCGTGCPTKTNAKQSMLVPTLPAASGKGAILISPAQGRAIGIEV